VRYSPSGSHFASAGFDGKVFLYDGSSADLIGEMGSPAHKGGVYAVSINSKCHGIFNSTVSSLICVASPGRIIRK
jgi:WD40 repeat protein